MKVTSTDLKNRDVTFNPTAPSDHGYEAHAAVLVSGLTLRGQAGEIRESATDNEDGARIYSGKANWPDLAKKIIRDFEEGAVA